MPIRCMRRSDQYGEYHIDVARKYLDSGKTVLSRKDRKVRKETRFSSLCSMRSLLLKSKYLVAGAMR